MNSPLLSIIVPIFNTEKFLRGCIESIINQDIQRDLVEIICVDDGSTDSSQEILYEYRDLVSIYRKQNGGLSSARNFGLERARGKYILFVDSDDFLLPGAISKMLSHLDEGIDAIIAKPKVIYQGTSLWNKEADEDYFSLPGNGVFNINDIDLFNIPVVAWAKIYVRSIIEKYRLRFPEGVLYEDNYFFWTYFLYTKKIYFLDEEVCAYVRHANGIMGNTAAENWLLNT